MNKSILFALICCHSLAFASTKLEKKIGEWFDKMHIVSNNTSSDSINSQLGVHYLGGHGVVRTTVEDVNPIHVSLPTFSAGCGGIDYTLGAINIASKSEMKKALKSIATNGASYAFMLGIETVSPIISSVMKDIQTWANQLNAININSCELGSALVQGLWPKSETATQYICSHAATTSPIFDDLIQAKHGCRDDHKKQSAAINKAKENSDFLAGDYNVAWIALEKVKVDPLTKQLFLNLTGTIVVKNGSISIFPPKVEEVMHVLQYGGLLKESYTIGKNNLDISLTDLNVTPDKSWKHRIHKTLCTLQEKILNEAKHNSSSLTDDEKSLLQLSHFPIGSLLSLMGQWGGRASSVISLDECANLIAFEKVSQLVTNFVQILNQRAESLRAIQVDGSSLDRYIDQLHEVAQVVNNLQQQNFQKVTQKYQMIEYLLNFDKQLRDRDRGV